MNEDDVQKGQGGSERDAAPSHAGADNEREVIASPRSLHVPRAPVAPLQGEGSWANLLTLLEISPDALVMVDQAYLFGRFVRASNSQAHGISGTGLGLYLCRELVEQHGGRIWFESIEGQGSTFFIALPIVSDVDPT